MKTNFKELLYNTNLTPVEILEYYLEEIDKRFKEFNTNFAMFLPSLSHYSGKKTYFYFKTLEEKQEENPLLYNKLIDITEYVGSAIKEFLNLYDIIETSYSSHIHDLVGEKEDCYKFLKQVINLYLFGIGELSGNMRPIHNCVDRLITYLKLLDEQEEKTKKEEIIIEDKLAILEFYVNELNRLLDEKEARIYELEDEQKKNEQEIDGLINENISLRRIIEINNDEEED